MVRFAVTSTLSRLSPAERFAAQLALARVHANLIALERTPGGYTIPRDETHGWFELRAKRGFAGYGLARALRMLLDVLAGLSALEDTRTQNGQPFVHGELVPAMLRVDATGVTRLAPLAPWHWSAPGTLPIPERFGHLAPERLLGDVIDGRADVFSAGVLLWEALAGRRLFETDSVDGIVMRLMGDKLTLPELPPELSWAAPLKAVAMCALSADPEQRFANCGELAEAIAAVAGDHVATHGEVAQYFRAPEPMVRSSAFDDPPTVPNHHSSLSALVAPLRTAEPTALRPSQPTREDSPPPRRVSRSVWAIAALSCAVGAIGASAMARSGIFAKERRSAAASAPAFDTPPPAVSSRLAAPSAASAPPAPLPAVSGIDQLALPADRLDPAGKSQKPAHRSKAPAAPTKLRAPGRPPRVPDKAAINYGI